MGKTNTKSSLNHKRDDAEREPPAIGLKGLVNELQDKPGQRYSVSRKKVRARHINESDEKEIKKVIKEAHDKGLREAERHMFAHKDSLREKLEELDVSEDDLDQLVKMKHDSNRRKCLDQALHELSDEDFTPIMIEVMNKETGECLPLFSDRRRLRKEKADATA